MRLFHYHLVTSKVREVEARYIGKLGFTLVARHGRIDEDTTSFESGHGWEELDQLGFKLRLSELERGAVNVVVQPGQWELPRLDHLGFALDEDDFVATLARAELRELRVQEHGGRRTFISTNAGYRLELHPPREWLDDFLEGQSELTLAELHVDMVDMLTVVIVGARASQCRAPVAGTEGRCATPAATPLGVYTGAYTPRGLVVPILRAGLGMLVSYRSTTALFYDVEPRLQVGRQRGTGQLRPAVERPHRGQRHG